MVDPIIESTFPNILNWIGNSACYKLFISEVRSATDNNHREKVVGSTQLTYRQYCFSLWAYLSS